MIKWAVTILVAWGLSVAFSWWGVTVATFLGGLTCSSHSKAWVYGFGCAFTLWLCSIGFVEMFNRGILLFRLQETLRLSWYLVPFVISALGGILGGSSAWCAYCLRRALWQQTQVVRGNRS